VAVLFGCTANSNDLSFVARICVTSVRKLKIVQKEGNGCWWCSLKLSQFISQWLFFLYLKCLTSLFNFFFFWHTNNHAVFNPRELLLLIYYWKTTISQWLFFFVWQSIYVQWFARTWNRNIFRQQTSDCTNSSSFEHLGKTDETLVF